MFIKKPVSLLLLLAFQTAEADTIAMGFEKAQAFRSLVESQSYQRTLKLCYSITYSERYVGNRFLPHEYLYLTDLKYRESVNEWGRAFGRGLSASFIGDEKEKLLQILSLYTEHLVNSEGFDRALHDCAVGRATYDELKKAVKWNLYGYDGLGNAVGYGSNFFAGIAAVDWGIKAIRVSRAARFLPVIKISPGSAFVLKAFGYLGLVGGASYLGKSYFEVRHRGILEAEKIRAHPVEEWKYLLTSPNEEDWSLRQQSYRNLFKDIDKLKEMSHVNPNNSDLALALKTVRRQIEYLLMDRNLVLKKLQELRALPKPTQVQIGLLDDLEAMAKYFDIRISEIKGEQAFINSHPVKTNEENNRLFQINVLWELQKLNDLGQSSSRLGLLRRAHTLMAKRNSKNGLDDRESSELTTLHKAIQNPP